MGSAALLSGMTPRAGRAKQAEELLRQNPTYQTAVMPSWESAAFDFVFFAGATAISGNAGVRKGCMAAWFEIVALGNRLN